MASKHIQILKIKIKILQYTSYFDNKNAYLLNYLLNYWLGKDCKYIILCLKKKVLWQT